MVMRVWRVCRLFIGLTDACMHACMDEWMGMNGWK